MAMFNANGNNTIAYNNFLHMPQVPYKIFERLATSTSQSAENLFKILKYAEVEALANPNLTYDEKMAMLWTPDKPNASQQNLFSIFLKPLVSSALDPAEQQIQLKIHRVVGKPINNVQAYMGYQFDMGLLISANYNFGLTNTVKALGTINDVDFLEDVSSKNSVLQFNVGWRF